MTTGISRRHLVKACSAAALGLCINTASAQAWPSKPVTLVVPFPPGGTTDVIARALAERLTQALGQTVIVESKPGAGATLGADMVAKSRPDGHTLLMGTVHHTIAPSIYKKLPYDFQKDFAPVSTVALVPNVLVINASTPAKNVKEFVALARSKPGMSYGSNGNGTAQHLIGTQFQNLTGVELVHVPYKGSGPLTTDLLGNQIALSFDTVTPVLQHIRSGKLRALAVTSAKRLPNLPNVPTVADTVPGYEVVSWQAIFAPAGTPKAIQQRLHDEVNKILAQPDVKERLAKLGMEPGQMSTDQFTAFQKAEVAKWAQLIKAANVKIE
jgi:tripartite-type tricarboxylate transporter receptor subunit TctC